MIVDALTRNRVSIRYRDEKGNRRTITDEIIPYLFIKTEEADSLQDKFKGGGAFPYTTIDGFIGLYGEELTKITSPDYDFMKSVRKEYDTWEANIPTTNRILCDNAYNIPNYEHRVWYLDCEWHPTTNQMRVIVVKDSFTQQDYVWVVHSDIEPGNHKELDGHTFDTHIKAFSTEKDMLRHFLSHMMAQDPDVITGWFVVGADIKTIIERCRANHLQPHRLSPLNRIRYEFGDWAQPIAGRNCIDLMIAFSKLWELKNGKLPGYKLDDVAREVLGQTKVELEDGHDTYYSDIATYIHYCIQDVALLPLLDEKVNALNHYLSLQHIVQCELKSTPFITKMFTCLTLQDEGFDRRIPTRPQFAFEPYEGAEIMEVEEGAYDNVGILDVKAMYHSNASLHNISWDTLEENPIDEWRYEDCGNGTVFYKGKKGLLVRLMDKMTDLRNHYKRLKKKDGLDKWDTMQFACKSLVASMYGVAGDSKYGMYHPKIAAAITYTSRATLNDLKVCAEKHGFKVLYGHTDSVFCIIPTPQEGEAKMRLINEELAPIEVEFEKWCSSMVLMAKNRYAGNVTWTEGVSHGDVLYVKGIELKQSRKPPIMKEVMSATLNSVLTHKNETETTNYIKDLIDRVLEGKEDDINLCMKGRLSRDLSKYKTLSGPSAGAAWANANIGKTYRKDSYFLTTLDENGKYIAFDDPKEIKGLAKIGYKELLERFVLKKVEPYYDLVGWDMQPLWNSIQQVNMRWV